MAEPNVNLRRQAASRRTFYSLSRRYGEQLTLRKLDTDTLDLTTGDTARTYTEAVIRNAVPMPAIEQRSVIYTPSMMQAIRQFAWQGGGQDLEESGFLIYGPDIPSTWGEIDTSQNIVWRDRTHEIVKVQEFDGGVLVWTTEVKSS